MALFIPRVALAGSVSLWALVAPSQAVAQTAPQQPPASTAGDATPSSDDASTEPDVVVRGIRNSLANAIRVKRDAAQIMDTISADDIGKLPDQNVAEALQRITGVQISRTNGQGSGVAIRGLSQVRYELDGASLTGTGTGRSIAFEAIPADLFGSLEVFKSPTPDSIEGGLGGTINLVTRRPLDMPKFSAAANIQLGVADYRGKSYPRLSGLISGRTDTPIGRIGLLVGVSFDQQRLRNDFAEGIAWDRITLGDLNGDGVTKGATTGPLTPDEVWRPRQLRQTVETQDRERFGVNATLQWEPSDTLRLTAIGSYNRYKFTHDYRLLRIDVDSALAQTTSYTRDAQGNLVAASLTNANFLTNNYVVPTNQTIKTLQLDADWKPGNGWEVRLNGNIARGKNYVPLVVYPTLFSNSRAPLTYNFNTPTGVPDVTTAYNLQNLSNFKINTVVAQTRDTTNGEDAIRFDVGRKFGETGLLRAIRIGARYTNATITYEESAVTGTALRDVPVTTAANLFPGAYVNSLTGGATFLDDDPGNFPRNWVGYSASFLQGSGLVDLVKASGITLPVVPQIASFYFVKERTIGGYLRIDLGGSLGSMPWSFNGGVRYVHTRVGSYAYLPAPPSGALAYTNQPSAYGDWLPSANFRFDLTDNLLLRLAAAKVIARPNPSNLRASTSFNHGSQTATAGNPTLSPFRAKQLDASLEWYFAPGSLLSVAGFYKDVSAFISNEIVDVTFTNPEFPGRNVYRLSRPSNGKSGKIKGFEIGFQHAFKSLPGFLSGFGVQANYTFIASTTPNVDTFTGAPLPLEGLSKNSYNLIGYYEKAGLQARLAYNWREKFLLNTVAGSPNFVRSAGQLDGSLSFDVTKQFTLSLEAINLTNATYKSYQGDEVRLLNYTRFGRQFMGGVRLRF